MEFLLAIGSPATNTIIFFQILIKDYFLDYVGRNQKGVKRDANLDHWNFKFKMIWTLYLYTQRTF
ncbi:hypothetical protein HanPSC8_Chr06g0250821 [Helianthus annuus]|nr:hypothetical protein HanPSC8_Chr06g0250821 [Helianthus annuus]